MCQHVIDIHIKDAIAKKQIDTLQKTVKNSEFDLLILDHPDQGIVHVIGPELGLTQPGKTIVCGDSHTSTHGAFGALAFGIGTSEVEHVLLLKHLASKTKNDGNKVKWRAWLRSNSERFILAIIAKFGIDVGTGYIIEYTGEAIRNLSMEERMTICNMSIEAGARAGLISPDETTFEYLKGREYVPKGEAFEQAVEDGKHLAY